MDKDFDKWNEKKKNIDKRYDAPFYHERDIWWCSMGMNVGVEANGKGEEYSRPVVVIKGFNIHSFLGVALTGRKREGDYYVYLGQIEDRDASANLSQIKLFDTKRLILKIGMLEETKFRGLVERIRETLLSSGL